MNDNKYASCMFAVPVNTPLKKFNSPPRKSPGVDTANAEYENNDNIPKYIKGFLTFTLFTSF